MVDRQTSFSQQTSGKHLIGDLLKFLDRTASKHLRKQEREELSVMLVFEFVDSELKQAAKFLSAGTSDCREGTG